MKPIWLWLDDVRVPPEAYTHWIGRSGPQSFVPFVLRHARDIAAISFDNDLGDYHVEGQHLMLQLRELVEAGKLKLPSLQLINVHTANSAAAPAIIADARCICGYVTRRFSEELGPRAKAYECVP